jgi:hypothetical protein
MVTELDNTKLHQRLRDIIRETLIEKVTEVELIESITCINALKNNEFDSNTMRTPTPTQAPHTPSATNLSPSTSASTLARIS